MNILKALISLLGWLLSYTYSIHLVGAFEHTCTMGNDSPHAAALILGPSTLVLAAILIWVGRRLAAYLRWFVLPHALTVAISFWLLPRYFLECTLKGRFICAASSLGGWEGEPSAWWHFAYAPIQFLAVAGFAWAMFKFWRKGSKEVQYPL